VLGRGWVVRGRRLGGEKDVRRKDWEEGVGARAWEALGSLELEGVFLNVKTKIY